MSKSNKVDGEQLLKDAKDKSKAKETKMKKFQMSETKKATIKGIVGTLIVLATIAGLIYTGWALNDMYDQNVKTEVSKAVAEVVSSKQ